MRATKYKAYIKEIGKVVGVTGIFNLKTNIFTRDEPFPRVTIGHHIEGGPSNYIIDGKDNHLMQSTGLKDKNGREIYEGDILGVYDYNEEAGRLEQYRMTVDVWEENNTLMLFDVKGCNSGRMLRRSEAGDYEVLGNVYENPEIIEGGLDAGLRI